MPTAIIAQLRDGWTFLREAQRKRNFGRRYLLKKWLIERHVLSTAPVLTEASSEDCEVHMMTYDFDWRMALWAAKSFYRTSQCNWPLIWHQGGELTPHRREMLIRHFPRSRFVSTSESDARVEHHLRSAGLNNCISARRRFLMLRKLLDPLVYATSRNVLTFDSDVLFFQRPSELIEAGTGSPQRPLYNRDCACFYSVDEEGAFARFGINLVPFINAGMVMMPRASVDWALIETLLGDDQVLGDYWLVEQTVHALHASRHGFAFLPDTYAVSAQPGLFASDGSPIIAKHYAGFPRQWLLLEGMPTLLKNNCLC